MSDRERGVPKAPRPPFRQKTDARRTVESECFHEPDALSAAEGEVRPPRNEAGDEASRRLSWLLTTLHDLSLPLKTM
jgi:hypothetical protein